MGQQGGVPGPEDIGFEKRNKGKLTSEGVPLKLPNHGNNSGVLKKKLDPRDGEAAGEENSGTCPPTGT